MRKYPVLYLLHGLGGTQQSAVLDGEWTVLQDLRRDHKIGEFIVVSPEAWDTFYVNSRDGKTPYSDFFLSEFLPYIERTYRIQGGAAHERNYWVFHGGVRSAAVCIFAPGLVWLRQRA